MISCKVIYQSDWNRQAQRALLNNAGTSHVFGDIEHACSEEMKEKSHRKVAVEVGLGKFACEDSTDLSIKINVVHPFFLNLTMLFAGDLVEARSTQGSWINRIHVR